MDHLSDYIRVCCREGDVRVVCFDLNKACKKIPGAIYEQLLSYQRPK